MVLLNGSYLNILYQTVGYPIIYIFPAYAANGAPVLFGGGKMHLDCGKSINGKRIFGNNKTINGTVAALICGSLVGVLEYPVFPFMLPIAILLAIGAVAGDLLGSFTKRQMGVRSGESILLLDQYGFFICALLLAAWLGHLPVWYGMVFIALLTGVLHIFTNRGAHRLKLKSVPW